MIYYVKQSSVIPKDDLDKKWREVLFCEALKAVLITSNFDHYSKSFREPLGNSIDISFIKTIGYLKNNSASRVVDAWFFSIKLFFVLLDLLKSGDVVVSAYPTPESTLICKICCKIKGAVFVVDCRDTWPRAFNAKRKVIKFFFTIYISLLNKLIFSFSPKCLAMSPAVSLYYGLKNPLFLPNPFVTVDSRPRSSKTGHTAVFFGSMTEQFDFNVFNEISNTDFFKSFDFHIYGDGPLYAYYESNLNFDNVNFHGRVPYEKIIDLCYEADVFFIPFKNPINFEGHYSNKISEMIPFNIPIITNFQFTMFEFDNFKYNIGPSIRELKELSISEIDILLNNYSRPIINYNMYDFNRRVKNYILLSKNC